MWPAPGLLLPDLAKDLKQLRQLHCIPVRCGTWLEQLRWGVPEEGLPLGPALSRSWPAEPGGDEDGRPSGIPVC